MKAHTSTLATLKETRRYKRARPPRTSPLAGRKIDWLGMFLWCLAGALVFAIAYVWQSRQRNETWGLGGRPVAETHLGRGRGPTPALPAAEPGTAAGHIAFQTMPTPGGPWDVYVMRADGTGRAPLVESDSDDTGPVWRPDGDWVAFVSDRDDNREIYVIGANGEGLRNLTNNAAEDWTPAWSPDGQYTGLLLLSRRQLEIYLMGADGSDPVRLTDNRAADYAPAWSPDGERIAFVSDRDGNLEIYSVSTEGGETWRLTDNVATDQSPAWSPDGAQILWESYRDDNMEIYIAEANGSNPRNVNARRLRRRPRRVLVAWGGAMSTTPTSRGAGCSSRWTWRRAPGAALHRRSGGHVPHWGP